MAKKLTTIIKGVAVQLDMTNTCGVEKQVAVSICYESALGAWDAAVAGYPSNSTDHTNHFYDNAGWVKVLLQTADGKWGGYIWLLQNTVNFKTSTTNVWVSTDGVTNSISKVLVGTIGDYPAMEMTAEDTGPTLEGLTNNPPTGGSSDDMSYPTGTWREISGALMGKNDKNFVFIEGNGWTNRQGELVDPWGGTYFFSFETNALTVKSSGPNGVFGDADDIVRVKQY